MPPRWVHRASLAALLVGLALVIVGPMAIYALGAATADGSNPQAVQESIKVWWSRLFWTAPLGGGLLFSGGIGLLFLWVTRLAEENDSAP